MEEYYDYTKSTHCISFEMMNNVLWCNCIDSDVQNNEQGYSEYETKGIELSILYHTSSGVIIATGIEADESWKSDKYHNDTYVPNILTELYGSYLSKKRQDYPNTLQDEVIMQEVIRVLQNCLEQKKRYFKIPSWEFHYVFTLPTIWDVEMRDEIRSLFFKAGLVQEHDHPDRLLLITELESRVRYIQSTDLGFPGTQLDNGRQYTMYALDFDEEVLIQMEIFSAHYPPTSIDRKRIPRLLEMSQFTIPYQIEKRVYIEACLEERYNIMLSPDLLNLLTNESDVPWDAKEKQRYHDPTVTKFHVDAMHIPFQKYFAYKPFKGLHDLYKGEYNLDTSEIKVIELITIGDIYTDLSDIIKAIFLQQMDPMFQDTRKGTEKIISTETKVKVSPKVNTIMFPCTENFSQSSDRQILLKFLEKWSEEYDEQQGIYKLIKFQYLQGESPNFIIDSQNISFGGLSLMKKQIKSANKFRDPKVISASAEKRSFDFYYSPSYFINVDITLTTVDFLILYEEEGNFDIIETEMEQCGVRSFDNFIVHSSLHERPLIKITKRMKQKLEIIFHEYLKQCSNINEQKTIKDMLAFFEGNVLEQLLNGIDLNAMFTKEENLPGIDSYVAIISRDIYKLFLVVSYLFYLNTLIKKRLDMSAKGKWIQKNLAYAISVDKWLLDNMFGTKEDLTELLFASGILQRNNHRRKAQIITRGEEILPAIEQKLTDFNFKMKSYFVVSQLHQTYIQLTLHQVVIVSEDETSSTTIIVEDKIIQIEDVYDTLCKTTWGSMIYPTSYIDYCTAHEDSMHILRNLESLFSYDRYCQEVKLAVPELVHFNKTMYLKFEHNICFNEEKCDCSIIIDPQNIVDIGMKSAIQDIATIMAGSLTNTELFGNYEVDFLFVLGNVFNIPHNSMAYIVYSNMLQESVSNSIDLKEKYTQGLVIREPLCEFLHSTTNIKPYIYDRFIAGSLKKVSRSTYGIRFREDIIRYLPFSRINCYGDITGIGANDGSYLVVLQTGQEIPISGLKLNLEITILSGTNCENLSLDIIRVEYSGESVNGFNVLEEATQGASSSIYIGGGLTSSARVIVEFEYVNYNYSLKVSAKRMGGKIDSSTSNKKHFILEDPLTLAYI